MRNLGSLQPLTHIKAFFSTTGYPLEFPPRPELSRGQWRTSYKVSLTHCTDGWYPHQRKRSPGQFGSCAKEIVRSWAETETREVFLHGAGSHLLWLRDQRKRYQTSSCQAMQNAPAPQNVGQLHAFLGMMNYYYPIFPDITTVLEPLHKLLRQDTTWYWKTE